MPTYSACRFTIFILLFLFLTSVSANEVIKITLVEDPWPPYIEGKTGFSAEGGRLINLYREIFKQIEGVEVNYLLLPWKRALFEVELGKQDGIMALFKTSERIKVMDFTDPIFTGRTLLWYAKSKFPERLEWDSVEDLVSYNIVMLRGSEMGRPLLDAVDNGTPLNITEVGTHLKQFEMISRDRAEITPLTEIVGYHLLQEHKGMGDITPMEKPLSSDDVYYMAFSKKSPAKALIPKINEVIRTMEEKGLIYKILTGQNQALHSQ